MLFIDSDEILGNNIDLIKSTSINNIVVSSSVTQQCNLELISKLIKNCSSLDKLYVYYENDAINIEELAQALESENSLLDLQFNVNQYPGPDKLLDSIVKNRNLTRIQTSGFNISISTIISLIKNKRSKLESLNTPINFNDNSNDTLFKEFGSVLKSCKSLKELFLYEPMEGPLSDPEKQVQLSDSLKDLFSEPSPIEILSIENLNIVTVPLLTELAHNGKQLRVVKLSSGTLNDSLMLGLCDYLKKTESMYYLSIVDNKLSSEYEPQLSKALESCKSIRELSLEGNSFQGDHLIETLSRMDQIQTLSLNSDYFSKDAKLKLQYYTSNSKSMSSFIDLKRRQIDFMSLFGGSK
eukprot:gene2174-2677_t